jgi:CheY-like chemotaxis protein
MNNFPILYAEDNDDDVFLLQHAFRTAEIPNPLQVVRDGQQAIDLLAGVGEFSDRVRHPLPCLVILDIKLPRKSGLEVLQWLRQASDLPALPVVMFSSSSRREDVEDSYHLGANSFIVKPAGMADRVELARLIKGYWLRFNHPLPSCMPRT